MIDNEKYTDDEAICQNNPAHGIMDSAMGGRSRDIQAHSAEVLGPKTILKNSIERSEGTGLWVSNNPTIVSLILRI